MSAVKFVPLVVKQVVRHRVRTLLTVFGIAIAMFLFTSVQAMEHGVARATTVTALDTTLVVYRKDRFCPLTSQLPQNYLSRIEEIDGVTSVIPMMIAVTNCRTSLDVVTFRGVPKERFLEDRRGSIDVIAGSIEEWKSRTDAALLGETLADRRGLRPGMMFDAAGITTYVAGIIRSDNAQDQNVAYTALEFVQLAGRDQLGIVTQFNVKVADPDLLGPVADAIDALFASAQDPTATFSEKAFVGRIAGDIIELVSFAGWVGVGSLVAVLALVANAIVLSTQNRIAEHAVLQAIGYSGRLVAALIIAEGAAIALVGGLLGAAGAIAVAELGDFALSVDGLSIPIVAGPMLLLTGLVICTALGTLAGFVPAVQASRREIAACFRAV